MKHGRILAMVLALCMVTDLSVHALAEHAGHTENCLACRIVDMIKALPKADDITAANAAAVAEQIHAIDRIKFDLSDDAYWAVVDKVVQRYHDAVEKVSTLTGGGWIAVTKKYHVAGVDADNLDLSEAQAQFTLEKTDGGAPQTLTLSSLP